MRTRIMRRLLMAGAAVAAVVLGLAGCPVPGTGVTVTGWFVAYYFNITSDVTVTSTCCLPGNRSMWKVWMTFPAGSG